MRTKQTKWFSFKINQKDVILKPHGSLLRTDIEIWAVKILIQEVVQMKMECMTTIQVYEVILTLIPKSKCYTLIYLYLLCSWTEISISYDCEKSYPGQFCALKQYTNLNDIEYIVPSTGETYHIVQSCMPVNINVTDCHNSSEGIMFIVVAQREYK